MAGKNKGGREVRKPKQAKVAKASSSNNSPIPTSESVRKPRPAK